MSSPASTIRDAGPASPCIKICVVGEDGLCEGCLRAPSEIAAWSGMSAAERWALIARLEVRRTERPISKLGRVS